MGIAANQARLMSLTARQSDLELKAQQISAIKMRLAQNSEQQAAAYSTALNNYSALNAVQTFIDNAGDGKRFVYEYGSYRVAGDGESGISGTDLKNAVATALGVADFTSTNPASWLSAKQAEYDTEATRISAQEKMYDMELNEVNTEHDAIKTEYDAIKSLVGDNVEKSFNVFG